MVPPNSSTSVDEESPQPENGDGATLRWFERRFLVKFLLGLTVTTYSVLIAFGEPSYPLILVGFVAGVITSTRFSGSVTTDAAGRRMVKTVVAVAVVGAVGFVLALGVFVLPSATGITLPMDALRTSFWSACFGVSLAVTLVGLWQLVVTGSGTSTS